MFVVLCPEATEEVQKNSGEINDLLLVNLSFERKGHCINFLCVSALSSNSAKRDGANVKQRECEESTHTIAFFGLPCFVFFAVGACHFYLLRLADCK